MMQFPQKSEGKELKILVQPETQHRARYLTEGSRGSVKDCTQQSFPTVKVTANSWRGRLSPSKQESKSDCGIDLRIPRQPSQTYVSNLTQLEGVNEPVVLQVFVANDAGRVKPHGFYQACRVTGRNTTACKEVDIDGTTVIEVSLDPSTNMTLAYVHSLALNWGHFVLKCGVENVLRHCLSAGWIVLAS